MKKILLTTTLLVATAGMASADLRLSGSARMGVVYTGGADAVAATADTGEMTALANANNAQTGLVTAQTNAQNAFDATPTAANYTTLENANDAVADGADDVADAQADVDALDAVAATEAVTAVHNRFTLNIDGTADADNGLSFFARVRIRGGNTGDGDTVSSGVSAPRVGVTYGGFTVAAGNIYGALESTPGLYDGAVGLTGLSWNNLPTNSASAGAFAWDSFSSAGGGANGVEVIYSGGAFSGHLSYSADDTGTTTTSRVAVNAAYSFGDWTVAGGYQDSDTAGETMGVVTVAGNFGDFGVGLAYAANEGRYDATRINGSYTFGGGTTVTAFATINQADSQDNAFGLGFTHSLGGATLAGGIVRDRAGISRADFGVRFGF